MPADNAGLRLPAQRKSPPGNQTSYSRHVTERAGPRPCISPVPNVGARATTRKHRRHLEAPGRGSIGKRKKAPFFRGPGGFLCASSKESLPGYRLPIAIGKSPGGHAAKPPPRSPALSAAIRRRSPALSAGTARRSPALSAAIRRPGGTSSYIPPAACREAVCWGHHLRPRYKTSMLRKG